MSANTIVAKARLRNFGNGVLEVDDEFVRFFVETGRFRKQRQITRKIPLIEVEGVERLGDDLSLTWKGTTEIFAIEEKPQIDKIYEKVYATLAERTKKVEQQVSADQERNKLAQATLAVMVAVDSLFAVLKSLHGRVDWKLVESVYNQAEENVAKLASQGASSISGDLKPLSAALHSHHPNEIAEKTCDALNSLYENFDGLASSEADSQMKLTIQASYLLNDMALGVLVGDNDMGKEGSELLKTLEDLAKMPGSRIDVNEAKASLDKFSAGKGKQSVILEEIKSMIEAPLTEVPPPKA